MMSPCTSNPRNMQITIHIQNNRSPVEQQSKVLRNTLDKNFDSRRNNVRASRTGRRKDPYASTMLESWLETDENEHFISRIAKYSTVPRHSRMRNESKSNTDSAQLQSESNQSTASNDVGQIYQSIDNSQDHCLLHVGAWCNESRS